MGNIFSVNWMQFCFYRYFKKLWFLHPMMSPFGYLLNSALNFQPQPLDSWMEDFHCINYVGSWQHKDDGEQATKRKFIYIIYPFRSRRTSTWWKGEHRNKWPTLLGLVLPACLSWIDSKDSGSSCSLFSCSDSSCICLYFHKDSSAK